MKMLFFSLLVALTAQAQQYTVSTIAGIALPPTPAAAVNSSVGNTNSVARDNAGNIYFSSGECVFKVDTNGVLTLLAGNGTSGYSGDGGPATQAQLSNPWGVAVDKPGNVYIADELNNRIRRVSPDGTIVTVAGVGTSGFSGDGAAAADAQLHFPLNVTLDTAGNLYIADYFNNRVRRVSPDGIIVTIAGGGSVYPGDNGLATSAAIAGPAGMAVDASGNLFVADRSGMRVRKISTNGIISTVAGTGTAGDSGDGGVATDAQLYLPSDVAIDAGGNLYIADFNNNLIRKVTSAGIISSAPSSAPLNGPSGVALDSAGNIYVADRFNNLIREISTSGTSTTIAGTGAAHFSGDGGPATDALFNTITGVALDQFGNLFIADSQNGRVREVTPGGTVTTFAGGGSAAPGDGGQATSARLMNPESLAFDPSGNLYIADSGDARIRKVSTSGVITTVAGNGTQGNSGDGGPALSAELSSPSGVAVDGSGNIFIINQGTLARDVLSGNSVREVSADGTITTLIAATTIASGQPITQQVFSPTSLAVDASGNLFVEEATLLPIAIAIVGPPPTPTNAFQILKVTPAGVTTTFAQTGGAMALDPAGDLYLAGGGIVQKISPSGSTASSPINGTVSANAIAVDSAGGVYAAEQYSVLLLQPASGQPFSSPLTVSAVVDAASESAEPISPGKIVAIYGLGLGPAQAVSNQLANGVFGTSLSGVTMTFNGSPAPMIYASATELIAVVPYEVTGSSAQVIATYQGQPSPAFSVPIAATAPSFFTRNQTGAGEAAAVNDVDGTLNTAANPAKISDYISFFATGEGQTTPAGVDGQTGGSQATRPNGKVTVTVGGLPATVQYAGGVFGEISGLMQVNVQIPAGVTPGGYVPVVLQVGTAASNPGTWIAVAGNSAARPGN